MMTIVPIVEGDGEVTALPELMRRIVYENYQGHNVRITRPLNAHGAGNLTAQGRIERFVQLALLKPECDAVLVLLDNDAVEAVRDEVGDVCAPAFARYLAERIRTLQPSKPVAVVVARWEYEAWLLASLETVGQALGLPTTAAYTGDVETERSAKGWLTQRMPPGRRYSETRDQVRATASLDLEQVARRSRSFRRLLHAWEELFDAHLDGRVRVTPY